jgi:phosphatidylglycerophosphatase A
MIRNRLAYIFATGLGSGYTPFAPGTAGSLLALFIYLLVPLDNYVWLIICTIVFFIGVWAANIVEEKHGNDPGIIVIDEFVGQWISLLFLPGTLMVYMAAFLLFRIFDILKPFPANDSQKITHGWGVMIDDVIAGIYANLVLQIVIWVL